MQRLIANAGPNFRSVPRAYASNNPAVNQLFQNEFAIVSAANHLQQRQRELDVEKQRIAAAAIAQAEQSKAQREQNYVQAFLAANQQAQRDREMQARDALAREQIASQEKVGMFPYSKEAIEAYKAQRQVDPRISVEDARIKEEIKLQEQQKQELNQKSSAIADDFNQQMLQVKRARQKEIENAGFISGGPGYGKQSHVDLINDKYDKLESALRTTATIQSGGAIRWNGVRFESTLAPPTQVPTRPVRTEVPQQPPTQSASTNAITSDSPVFSLPPISAPPGSFRSESDARFAGRKSGDVILLWDASTGSYRRARLK